MKKRVYIAGPISKGDLKHNIDQATRAFITLVRAGFSPLCPHWSCYSGEVQSGVLHGYYAWASSLPNELTHAEWCGLDLAWVDVSDAVLRLPGDSVGADGEVTHARERGIPVFESIEDLIAKMR